jgi:hypothetical protein
VRIDSTEPAGDRTLLEVAREDPYHCVQDDDTVALLGIGRVAPAPALELSRLHAQDFRDRGVAEPVRSSIEPL